jgi:hypothetical protein
VRRNSYKTFQVDQPRFERIVIAINEYEVSQNRSAAQHIGLKRAMPAD